VENLANSLIGAYFSGRSVAEDVEAVAQTTLANMNERLQAQMLEQNAVLSIIKP
jgi:hypothetical protein